MPLEYNARVDYRYTGGNTIFSVPFSYINKAHVVVVINNDSNNPITDFTWLSENQIQLKNAINTGATVSVRRVTPINNKLVTFEDNNILDEETQNLAQDQVFNVVQEVSDNQNNLKSNMQEFIDLKDTVNYQLERISDTGELVQEAYDLFQETTELAQGVSQAYEDLREGVPVNLAQNLFTINFTDKTLSEEESIGLALQGSTQTASNYPDAYQALVKEYLEGEEKIYQDENVETVVQTYKGDLSGKFYLPADLTLSQGTELYSDITCSEILGTITEFNKVNSYKYNGAVTESFYTLAQTLDKGMSIYSDKALLKELGKIEDIYTGKIDEYKLATFDKVYKPINETLSEGSSFYLDPACTQKAGTITYLGTLQVDKYSINHPDFDYFYVPSGTQVSSGTIIYEDSSLTKPLGTVKTKGINVSSSYFYYKAYCTPTPLATTKSMIVASWTGNKYSPTIYFYTRELITNNCKVTIYSDKKCTISNTTLTISNGLPIFSSGYTVDNGNKLPTLVKKVAGGDEDYSYIILENDTDLTQFALTKLATTSVQVLKLDNKTNYEYYEYLQSIQGTFIKITDLDYQVVTQAEEVSVITIKIDEGNTEEVIEQELTSQNGIVFKYRENSNGHRIVNSSYKTQVLSLLPSPFYILDTENSTFTLPVLDKEKLIYVCVGNTKLKKASIRTITENELYSVLGNYVNHDDIELLDELSDIVITYNTNLTKITQALELATETTNEILGDL